MNNILKTKVSALKEKIVNASREEMGKAVTDVIADAERQVAPYVPLAKLCCTLVGVTIATKTWAPREATTKVVYKMYGPTTITHP